MLQDVSGDIATLLQPDGAGAAEMDSDQHARERVLARSIEHVVVGTRQCGIRTGAGRACRGVLERQVGAEQGGQYFSGGSARRCVPGRVVGDRRRDERRLPVGILDSQRIAVGVRRTNGRQRSPEVVVVLGLERGCDGVGHRRVQRRIQPCVLYQ